MLDRTDQDGMANSGGALRDALRRARAEAAEQTDVVVDLRHAEIARLEILREELEPVFAQVPREIDIFDVGLAPGERPRLFVDMVAFVEMARDRRTYQFLRDGRHGRSLIAESDRLDPIVEAVTSYVARRLIERERILADDDRIAGLADTPARIAEPQAQDPAPAETSPPPPPAAPEAPPRRASGWARAAKTFGAFLTGAVIGAIAIAAWMLVEAGRFPAP